MKLDELMSVDDALADVDMMAQQHTRHHSRGDNAAAALAAEVRRLQAIEAAAKQTVQCDDDGASEIAKRAAMAELKRTLETKTGEA